MKYRPLTRYFSLWLGLLCISIASWATNQPATTVTDTSVRKLPSFQAPIVKSLKKNSPVQLRQRQGGWYEVMVDNAIGWLPILAVRLAPINIGHRTGSGVGKLLATFSRGPQAIAASTGVRGLSAQDIKRARPNFAALNYMLKLRVSADAAADWARRHQRHPHPVPYIEEVRP